MVVVQLVSWQSLNLNSTVLNLSLFPLCFLMFRHNKIPCVQNRSSHQEKDTFWKPYWLHSLSHQEKDTFWKPYWLHSLYTEFPAKCTHGLKTSVSTQRARLAKGGSCLQTLTDQDVLTWLTSNILASTHKYSGFGSPV